MMKSNEITRGSGLYIQLDLKRKRREMNGKKRGLEWLYWKKWLKWLEDVEENKKESGLCEDEYGFTPYPLQIANAIRIMENDAVFIFDEVGCGKTISAGIMAETYLHNECKNFASKSILVITTNTIKGNGQFIDDWKKLDPKIVRYTTIYNNLANSDLKNLRADQKWGLVIIDEAHEFNNTGTARFSCLIDGLRAEKVVFLTATPLRGGGDFGFYKQLSRAILDKSEDEDVAAFQALDKLGSLKLKGESDLSDLICARFDPTYPVTRYFKDTVKYLDLHEKKEKAHRVIPEIWKLENGEFRADRLIRGLACKLAEDKNNRFVIFVRLKEEAKLLEEKITNAGIKSDVIFADSKYRLADYSGIGQDLPTVLIINYQIGEAGINLPGYNHVIHWHISADPARLEQRYGRIDRLTSRFERIHSVFVDSPWFDSNQSNFMDAIYYTMGDLLTCLPARNVILTEETLEYYKQIFMYRQEEMRKELKLLQDCKDYLVKENNSNEVSRLLSRCCSEEDQDFSNEERKDEWGKISQLIKELGSTKDANILFEEVLDTISKKIRMKEKQLNNKNDKSSDADEFAKRINEIKEQSDKIFYLTERYNPGCLKTIAAQGTIKHVNADDEKGCATYIEEKEEYGLLRELIRLLVAAGLVKAYSFADVQYATEFIDELGEIAYDDDWKNSGCKGMIDALGYKHIR